MASEQDLVSIVLVGVLLDLFFECYLMCLKKLETKHNEDTMTE